NGAAFGLGVVVGALLVILMMTVMNGGFAAFGATAALGPAFAIIVPLLIATLGIVALLATINGDETWKCFGGGFFASLAIAGVHDQSGMLLRIITLIPGYVSFTYALDMCI
ncbi:MAG: hypothetical protein R8L53_08965, partial [Mariprofundales bacterium]